MKSWPGKVTSSGLTFELTRLLLALKEHAPIPRTSGTRRLKFLLNV